MPFLQAKKNKINLADYNYRRDIETRLLLAHLSCFEADVLREILDNSLVIPLKQLANLMDVPESKLLTCIEKFIPSKLLKLEGSNLVVDKETRKYYETQIVKFDENFEPGMEFLQGILLKIPVQCLQQWYSIPRTSDHIYQYLLDKFLATPKAYEKYLEEIQFDSPTLLAIKKDVFEAPAFKISAQAIMDKYKLTPAQFEEYVLLLEYNFVCCLCYEKTGDCYQESITPYSEWKEYLHFKRDTCPKPIIDTSQVILKHPDEFGFINDMVRLIEMALKKAVPINSNPLLQQTSPEYFESILQKIKFHRFGEVRDNKLYVSEAAQEWLKKPIQNKALTFSRHPIKVEKSLKRVLGRGWVYVDDFIRGFTGTLPGKEPIQLQQKGKRWKYVLPTYTEEEIALIETTLCERLFEAGVVAVGTHEGRKCFKVTPFGRMTLED